MPEKFKHAVTISFGLEAHVMGMTRACYDEIVATSVPGSNAINGYRQHSFPVPRRFNEPWSSNPDKERTVNIFLAWVSHTWVWALVDFSRLVKFHVVTRALPWLSSYLLPGSQVSIAVSYDNLLPDRGESADVVAVLVGFRNRT